MITPNMDNLPSGRLSILADKYARAGDLPAGEAFQHAFRRFLKANRESLLDITVAAASVHISVGDGPQDVDPLLLQAIYDTNPSITDDRLFALDGDALQGAVNTAKGKYFEYLVVDKLSQGQQVGPLLLESGQQAVLADSMTQPGWDLRIVDEHGDVVEYLQLKATDSVSYIRSALERYPDIQILATDEVVDSGLVLDSGISDQDLRANVEMGVNAVDVSLTETFRDSLSPAAAAGSDGPVRGISALDWSPVDGCVQAGLGTAQPTDRCDADRWCGGVCHGRWFAVDSGGLRWRPGVRQNHQPNRHRNVVPGAPGKSCSRCACFNLERLPLSGRLDELFQLAGKQYGNLVRGGDRSSQRWSIPSDWFMTPLSKVVDL
ncbi:MAG: hypothetical protein IPH37_15145 [Burkholderiales bacterium]|nr:hypothetical protein [Burkholderiales bacterium]